MGRQVRAILKNPLICAELKRAWEESKPGLAGGHEEGGFIVRGETGEVTVVRWPAGAQMEITLLPHPGCKIDGRDILASFHTHPNTGRHHLQEPSPSNCRAVRDDPELTGPFYEGELVISQDTIYHIDAAGRVSTIADTREVFAKVEGA